MYVSLKMGAVMGLALGCIPFLMIFTYICIQYQYVSLILLAIVNYFLMGFGRYVTLPFPVSITFDIIFGLIFFTTM